MRARGGKLRLKDPAGNFEIEAGPRESDTGWGCEWVGERAQRENGV